MVFITENDASLHAVNLAVALARPDIDSIHVMHACSNDGATPDAQKLMARVTQGLGLKVNSEVMVSRHICCSTCCTEQYCVIACLCTNELRALCKCTRGNFDAKVTCMLMHSSQSILVNQGPC